MRRWRADVGAWLRSERDLRLKHPQARVLSCAGHLDALGYRITRQDRRALPHVDRRLRGRLGRGPVESRLAAYAGILRF